MKIDRSNYEIWLIDWLDGNLSDLQVERLKLFIGENPDLREEFEGMTSARLKRSEKSFLNKEHLKKSTADLSVSQFEYLCVAYLENDLSADQQAELKEIIDPDPEKKKLFELIQKMRLAPAATRYKYKSKLIKRTPLQTGIRLSVIGLSAAATIAILIMTYLLVPRKLSDININTSQNSVADSSLFHPSADNAPDQISIVKNPYSSKPKGDNLIAKDEKIPVTTIDTIEKEILQNDSLFRTPDYREPDLHKIPVFAEINLRGGTVSNTLVASNVTYIVPPYDDRSTISKFIAKNIREKVLKDKTFKVSPLKVYEIAEAGVIGLNKLLGWNMSVNENNDVNGELKSIYFSSKILKFNAPVKKTEPLQ